ncbi:hypothetical protein SARC_00695 [Sphaeroforma arctica JP610]|uniref:Uncharacterized protein n=1 Tax=Sphaeroforma arctica JP610 TaxID=667725 RepID=A0A0L0GDS8_9EUKA|nr:hypothetical protein SARC_00695 [Sphaeroforma arctica JP610]KNC87167.1 hypothetical protein SARC_00695 [Sphaeroforma arctica JP610]|eukprot:XP_014161069.1 hypothetical protein SARC_00695 [Sphaeroforma arctica JP610]
MFSAVQSLNINICYLQTSEGRAELLEAGQYARTAYLSDDASTPIVGVTNETLDPGTGAISVRSSDTDRTLESAHYFLDGLLNGATFVPIHATSVDTDMILRGHFSCPKYQQKLDEFYVSDEFTSKEESTEALRQAAQAMAVEVSDDAEQVLATLQDVYNVYDILHSSNISTTNPTYIDIEQLAFWLEYERYSSDEAITASSGRIMYEIWQQFDDVVKYAGGKPQPVDEYIKVQYYSAHYSVIIPLLDYLHAETKTLTTIPSPGTVLAFELYRNLDDSGFNVRVVLRSPEGTATPTATATFENSTVGPNAVVLPIDICGTGNQEFCNWTEFKDIVTMGALANDTSWCDYCTAEVDGQTELSPRCTMVGSDVTSQMDMSGTLTVASTESTADAFPTPLDDTAGSYYTNGSSTMALIIGIVGLILLLGALIALFLCIRRRRNSNRYRHDHVYQENSHPEMSSTSHKPGSVDSQTKTSARMTGSSRLVENSDGGLAVASATEHANPLYVSGNMPSDDAFSGYTPPPGPDDSSTANANEHILSRADSNAPMVSYQETPAQLEAPITETGQEGLHHSNPFRLD